MFDPAGEDDTPDDEDGDVGLDEIVIVEAPMRGQVSAEIPMAEGKRLRIQAGQIRDLAHFEALIAQVDPAMRVEVRALLAQLVPFDVPAEEGPDAP